MAKAGREDILFKFMSGFEAYFPKRTTPPLLVRPNSFTKMADKQGKTRASSVSRQ